MFSVGKVLCPVDFSAVSERAVGVAAEIARQCGADLYLLHVVEGPPPADEVGSGPLKANEAREAIKSRLGSLIGGPIAESHHLLVTDGSPAEEILRITEVFGMDLIVLAPHGRTTIGKILFGSVAEKVVRGTEAAVLLVKARRDESPVVPV